MKYVKIDDVLDLFGIDDRDIYARGTIEDALYDGTLPSYDQTLFNTDTPPIKHGHWISKFENGKVNTYCSVCGNITYGLYHYCPDCGVKMDLTE